MAVWTWGEKGEGLRHVFSKGEGKQAEVMPASAVRSEDIVIVAGGSERLVPHVAKFNGAWLMNIGVAKKAWRSRAERQKRWQRISLQESFSLEQARRYKVQIAHHDLVSVQRLDSNGRPISLTGPSLFFGKAIPKESTLLHEARGRYWSCPALAVSAPLPSGLTAIGLRRLGRAAVLALYCLELDFGEVDLSVSEGGQVYVHQIDPIIGTGSEAGERLLSHFCNSYEQRIGSKDKAENQENIAISEQAIVLGADPEFLLLRPGGKVAMAARYLGKGASFDGTGSDSLILGERMIFPVAELRPAPTTSPEVLVSRLRQLLAQAHYKVSDPAIRFAAGAMPAAGIAIGGHVHVSGAYVHLTSRLLRILDSCLALPLALVSDPAGGARRKTYGALGDYRLQPHGGFEYRSLPSWLSSPKLALAVFATTKFCLQRMHTLPNDCLMDEKLSDAYYADNRLELLQGLDKVVAALSTQAGFSEVAGAIEPLWEMAYAGVCVSDQEDIRPSWGIDQEVTNGSLLVTNEGVLL